MSERQCNRRRVSTFYTSTLQAVRSTPLTRAREPASDRSMCCRSIVDSLGSGQSLAYVLFLTRVRKQTRWTKQDRTWRWMSMLISSHRHTVVYVDIFVQESKYISHHRCLPAVDILHRTNSHSHSMPHVRRGLPSFTLPLLTDGVAQLASSNYDPMPFVPNGTFSRMQCSNVHQRFQ